MATDDRYRSLAPRPPDAHTVTLKHAARILNVDRELVEGLAISHRLLGYRTEGKTGQTIVLIDRDDLNRVERSMK